MINNNKNKKVSFNERMKQINNYASQINFKR